MQLVLGERAHVPIERGIGDHLAQTRSFLHGRAPVLDAGGDRFELGVLLGEWSITFAAGLNHRAREFGMPGHDAVELGFEILVRRLVHGPSTRRPGGHSSR